MPQRRQNIGIDTSVLVRLLTGHPKHQYLQTKTFLTRTLEKNPTVQFVVSNQVIGETYVALYFHYKIDKDEARSVLLDTLNGGLLEPLNGGGVLECLRSTSGCGLVDRLIANGYEHEGMAVLTHDRKMGNLENGLLVK